MWSPTISLQLMHALNLIGTTFSTYLQPFNTFLLVVFVLASKNLSIRNTWKGILLLSYNTIVLYSRDHKGVGMAHEKNITQIPASHFPDENEAVLVRPKRAIRSTQNAFNKLLQNRGIGRYLTYGCPMLKLKTKKKKRSPAIRDCFIRVIDYSI